MTDATPEELEKQEQWLADQMAPAVNKGAFICPHCGAYAHQTWYPIQYSDGQAWQNPNAAVTQCAHCKKLAYWVETSLIFPLKAQGPLPHRDMPPGPRADYIEARNIVGLSPRGACALLRLALQKLCTELGEKGKDLNKDIASLVERGLSAEVQQALDSLRVVGNNAVHPGEFDVTDDVDTATALFECLNLIVEQLVAQPRRVSELYSKLPQGARDAITARDSS